MPDLNSMISAQRIMRIKKYLTPNAASWKYFLDFHLRKVGGKFLFHCNFNYSKLSITLPKFLWNNRFICIESRSVFNQKLIEVGIITIRKLLDSHGNFKQIFYLQHAHLSPTDHYFLFSLFCAIPEEWRRLLKTNENADILHDCYVDLDSFSLHLGGKKVDVEKIQSKQLYETFSSKISSNPTSMKKYNERFNTKTFELDWERIFSLPFKNNAEYKVKRIPI